jgi:glycosyltransferase involved in cell wall biosynthesis
VHQAPASSAETAFHGSTYKGQDAERPIVLTVVAPARNEGDNIAPFVAELLPVLESLNAGFEVVLVDDGSSDGTWAAIEACHDKDPRVHGLRLRRGFGKTAALLAGFGASRGAIIVTMDCDLQDDPSQMPNLLAKLDEGFDLVTGWKWPRRDPWSKTIPSRIFNASVSSLTGVPLHDVNCGFKAYRAEIVHDLKLYADMHRFTPVMAAAQGYRVTEVQVHHRARVHGSSKYGWTRLGRGLFDLLTVVFLTKFMQRPLHLFGAAGALLLVPGIIINLYLTLLRLQGERIGGRPLLLLAVLLVVAGFQLISTGLLGEMLRHVTYRPTEVYSIKERLE